MCFHREPANIGKIGDNFFLNRTVPLWNDLPVKVKEAKSLNGFKTGLDGLRLNETSHLQHITTTTYLCKKIYF